MKILVINGPNLNLLGTREPEIYGSTTLEDINQELVESNDEGEIIDKIHSIKNYDGLIINPAAYTHTSIAISDAIKATKIKAVEVHLSNIYSREDYRKNSFTASSCIGSVAGFNKTSYKMALLGLYDYLKNE